MCKAEHIHTMPPNKENINYYTTSCYFVHETIIKGYLASNLVTTVVISYTSIFTSKLLMLIHHIVKNKSHALKIINNYNTFMHICLKKFI